MRGIAASLAAEEVARPADLWTKNQAAFCSLQAHSTSLK
jgi:hypothetical protein